jgi:hypothetical protein
VQSARIVNDLNTSQKKQTLSDDLVMVTVYAVPDSFEAAPESLYMDEGVSEDLTLTLPEGCTNDSPVVTFKVYNSAEEELAEPLAVTLNNPSGRTAATDEESRDIIRTPSLQGGCMGRLPDRKSTLRDITSR